jgi:hypothetical protein
MPYTDRESRPDIDMALSQLPRFNDSARLNYTLTKVCLTYLLEQGISYKTCESIKGALGEVIDEFRDRVVKPYEKMKRKKNSDIDMYEEVSRKLVQMGCDLGDPRMTTP